MRDVPRRTGRLRAAAAAGLSGALLLAGLPAAPAAATSPGEGPQRTVTYDVRTRGAVLASPAAFARVAAQTLADRRGWSLGGSARYRQVASGGQFTLWLAAPSSMTSFSSVCSAQYSCRVGRNVVINDLRWRVGTTSWPTVREYRHYVLNHELGHWLGMGHATCPRAGAPAPVMVQQSKGLGGCRSTTWPLDAERRTVGARLGVAVRAKAPALSAVKRAAGRPTEVHVLSGASRWASWLHRSTTPLSAAEGPGWTARLADHDRDGVEDLYAVEHGDGTAVRVRVLSGASGYRSLLLDRVTPLRIGSSRDWTFDVADADGDGHLDLFGIYGAGGSGRTELHVLDGASSLRGWRLRTATSLGRTTPEGWALTLGDADRDGAPDLYAVARRGGSGRSEVHVLSGSAGYRSWLVHGVLPLGPTPATEWSYEVEDVDGNGFDDLVALDRSGTGGRTDVHVLDRTSSRWLLRTATALPAVPDPGRWSLDLS